MYFSYLQQPKTCHRCGSNFHTVNQCDIERNTKPQDRDNAINLDINEFSAPGSGSNNRSRLASVSIDDSDSDFEDCKSALSNGSDTDDVVLVSNPIQSVQENHANEDQSENVNLPTECDYTSNGETSHEILPKNHSGEALNFDLIHFSDNLKSQENHTNEDQRENLNLHSECDYTANGQTSHEGHPKSHTGEAVTFDLLNISDILKAPPITVQTQIPIPKARSSLISSSQQIGSTFAPNQKRQLSLSPQNIFQHQSKSKTIKLTGTGEYV